MDQTIVIVTPRSVSCFNVMLVYLKKTKLKLERFLLFYFRFFPLKIAGVSFGVSYC